MELVNKIIESYVTVMGAEKWDALSAKEQHDVVMTIVKDLDKALDLIKA